MEISPQPEKRKSPFLKGLLYFGVGLLALSLVSLALNRFMGEGFSDQKGKIGLIELTGMISDSKEIVRQLKSFEKNQEIQGIMLRVDTPGGAVAPSQEIYDEVLRVRRKGKRVYSSMGNLAASGGYYIAAATDRIFANPGTLTGSIGVIMAFSNLEGLMEKVGARPEIIKAGKFKDTGSPGRSMTAKEKKYLQNVVDDVHVQFIEAVAKGRRLSMKEATELADGRIFTGRQAFEAKLVDEIGGLEDAIASLGKSLGIEGSPRVVQEVPPKSFLDWLVEGRISDALVGKVWSSASSSVPNLQFLWMPGADLNIQ